MSGLQSLRRQLPVLKGISGWTWVAAGSGATLLGAVAYQYRRRRRKRKEAEADAQAKRNASRSRSQVVYFLSGFTSALVVAGCVQLVRRYRYPNPERVFSYVLPMLRANRELRDIVGTRLEPGLFRAYAYTGGLQWKGLSLRTPTSAVSYKPRFLQLMFQVNGEVSSAMVSTEVRRKAVFSNEFQFRSLAVDLPNGERLVLKGSSSDIVFQGYTRLR